MLWAPCFTGAPLHAPGPPCPQRGRPCSPQRPAAQVRLGGRTGRRSPVLVPSGSSANPICPLGLFLSPPRSQDPTPTSAPQEATDGGKVAEPSGEPLPTVRPACPPAYCPPPPPAVVPWPCTHLLFGGLAKSHVSGPLSSAQPPVGPWSASGTSRPPSEGQALPPSPSTGDWLGSSFWGAALGR